MYPCINYDWHWLSNGSMIIMFYGSYRDRLQNKLNKYKKIPTVLWIWIHWIRMRIQHFKWIKIRIRIFFFFMYVIQHCFICRPSESTVSEDAGIKPRTVATLALTARLFNHSARSHPHSARSHIVLNPGFRYSSDINHILLLVLMAKAGFTYTVWGQLFTNTASDYNKGQRQLTSTCVRHYPQHTLPSQHGQKHLDLPCTSIAQKEHIPCQLLHTVLSPSECHRAVMVSPCKKTEVVGSWPHWLGERGGRIKQEIIEVRHHRTHEGER